MNRVFKENGKLNIKEIKKVIDAFSSSTEIPVTVFDENMAIEASTNDKYKICSNFKLYSDEVGICRNKLRFSSELSSRLGEPYIFTCLGGFVNIALAILANGKFRGAFIAGPIVMNSLDYYMIENLLEMNSNSMEECSKAITLLRDLKIFSPKQVSQLAYLLFSSVLSLYSNIDEYQKLSMEKEQQAKIGEKLYERKKKNIPLNYPYDKEKRLIEKVKEGNSEEAQKILKSLFNEILLIEYGNIEVVKARVLELCTILSRTSVEGGASLQKIFGLNFDFITSLSKINNIQDLYNWTVRITNNFADNVLGNIYSGSSYIINQAVQHINSNYMNKITLKKLANYLHVNQSYMSRLFKKEMNMSFSEYLNDVRIKRSKNLLKNSDMPILEIALYVGYDSQSYFTKVFKKITGTTPKRFRDSCN